MTRSYRLSILFFLLPLTFAIEPSSLNFNVPCGLAKKELVFSLQHRFYGKINDHPLDNAFGIDQGANAGLALRYRVWAGLELAGSYTRQEKEYGLAAGYAFAFPRILRCEAAVNYFDYKKTTVPERRRNFFYQALFQSEPVLKKILVNLTTGYDGYHERFGLGFGLDVGTDINIGPIEGVHLVAEYSPVIDPDTASTQPRNSFAVGFKARTYGHNFMFAVGNNTEIGSRRLMLGASANDLYLAVNIQRFLKL